MAYLFQRVFLNGRYSLAFKISLQSGFTERGRLHNAFFGYHSASSEQYAISKASYDSKFTTSDNSLLSLTLSLQQSEATKRQGALQIACHHQALQWR